MRPPQLIGRRCFASSASQLRRPRHYKDPTNYNKSSLSLDDNASATSDVVKLTRLNASQLAVYREPPKGVSVLTRDFIHDALYNPSYGYFSRQAVIFNSPNPFDFRSMRDASSFDRIVSQQYTETGGDAIAQPGPGKQVWHTPVELFQPYYGQAIAQCLVSEYLLKYFPYEDFIIYEMGGGNGTLALNVLDFLRSEYPEVYERTQYKIIEISPNLAEIQRNKLSDHAQAVQVINKSIFEWDEYVASPCFFVALEVIDNFAHDVIRYGTKSSEPYQGIAITTADGDYEELFEPLSDPLITRYLKLRTRTSHTPPALSSSFPLSSTLRSLRNQVLPFAPNLTRAEFLPTQLLTFLELLQAKFPLHRLLLSDFSSLPNSIGGGAYNAPVVQTMYRGTMVPCSTYLVKPGYFDIFFPTNFELLRDMYEFIMSTRKLRGLDGDGLAGDSNGAVGGTGRLDSDFFSSRMAGGRRSPLDIGGGPSTGGRSRVYSHREFLQKYGDLTATTVRSGENPMLDYYQNVKIMF